ncbi:MAG TPA: hypothetical protein VLS49_00755, partial [Usitatibacter sp.]|nr:hypothetical protein [Usitatibacter sp.]
MSASTDRPIETGTPGPANPPPAPRRRIWPRVLAIVAAIVVIGLLAAAGGAWWLLATPGGAQFLAGKVRGLLGPGARIERVEGRIGGLMRIGEIEIDQPDLYVRVEDVVLDTAPAPALHGTLEVRRLSARSVEVRTASSAAAAKAPVIFKPPFPVRLQDGRVATLRIGAITPQEKAAQDPAAKRAAREAARAKDLVLHDIVLQGAGDARRWTVTQAAVTSEYGTAHAKGTIGNAKPYALDLQGDAAGSFEEHAYRIAARLGGTLERLEANAEGTVAGTRATARATVEPFAKQPVKSVALDASGVDLAHVKAGLPATRLDVHAALVPEGDDFAGPVRIANAAPGRWDRGALPVTEATTRVSADPSGRVQLSDLRLALAGGGTASGSASAASDGMKADLTLAAVDLSALHSKLQATKLTGSVSVSGDRAAQRFALALEDPRFAVRGNGSLAASRLAIETATVKTGAGAVTAKGTLALDGAKPFRVEGRAEHFDPSALVKTAAGDLNFDFTASGAMGKGGVAGEARVAFAPSRYAGLPLTGHANLAGDARRISAADVHLALGEARIDARGSFG